MKKAKIIFPLVLLLTLVLVPLRTDAYVILGGKWSNANALTYWYSATVTDVGYADATIHGSTAWNSSTKIETSRITSDRGASIKWYGSFSDLGDFYAATLNYVGNTPSWTGTYTNSTIRWNQPVTSTLDANRIKETATHELGHSLGLDHSNTTNAIMRATGWIYGTYPIQDDWNGINAIY